MKKNRPPDRVGFLRAPARRGAAALLLGFALTTVSASGQSRAGDERAVWALWNTHSNNLDRADTVLAACREFENQHPRSPFLDVSRGLAAWHLLKTGQTRQARETLESMPFEGAPRFLAEAAKEMARAWITRLDREKVVLALRRYYAREVAFPESLDALQSLPSEQRPPMTDAWGNPWRYRLRSFRFLKGIDNQRYLLESRTLGPDSELEAALRAPYGGALKYRPLRRVSTGGGTAAVQFLPPPAPDASSPTARPMVASPGSMLELARFAHLGEHLVILADFRHWNLIPLP